MFLPYIFYMKVNARYASYFWGSVALTSQLQTVRATLPCDLNPFFLPMFGFLWDMMYIKYLKYVQKNINQTLSIWGGRDRRELGE